jgi:wyosine [tRNA(Phe)-imidazoG37] synthetase (radical SAM superfamily)
MRTIYGPVSSWRLGKSLGVDLICRKKVCSFDCVYCQLGPTTEKTVERKTFVPTELVARELKRVVRKVEVDVVTFSGTGEPTLAQNLGEAIKVAKEISSAPVAVLTNSSLMGRKDVRKDLAKADIVKGKLDAPNEELFKAVNKPHEKITFWKIVDGMKRFRHESRGKLALEIMFIDENKFFSKEIAAIARAIGPDEIQINTPLRPSPVIPLTQEELKEVQLDFKGMNFVSVYGAKRPDVIKKVGLKKLRVLKRVE